MYEHILDFHSALQVARQYDPQSVPSILINQAKTLIDKREIIKAETCFINAGKPELAIKMYTDIENFQ
jgi:intraflagellar transport protein 172